MKLFLLILLAVTSGSYSWGMRGRIIGNQRGAYLPGALLGIIISIVACTVLGITIEAIAYRPLRQASSSLAVSFSRAVANAPNVWPRVIGTAS